MRKVYSGYVSSGCHRIAILTILADLEDSKMIVGVTTSLDTARYGQWNRDIRVNITLEIPHHIVMSIRIGGIFPGEAVIWTSISSCDIIDQRGVISSRIFEPAGHPSGVSGKIIRPWAVDDCLSCDAAAPKGESRTKNCNVWSHDAFDAYTVNSGKKQFIVNAGFFCEFCAAQVVVEMDCRSIQFRINGVECRLCYD